MVEGAVELGPGRRWSILVESEGGGGVLSRPLTESKMAAWSEPRERSKEKVGVEKVDIVAAVALTRARSKTDGWCPSGPHQVGMPGRLRHMRSC
jgi:hypothetical protein